MFVIIGLIIVVASVLLGFMFAGGNFLILIQPAEFVIIIGAAVGSLVIASPAPLLKRILAALMEMIKSDHMHKEDYLEVLKSFNVTV